MSNPNAASRTSSKVTNPTNETVDKHRSIYKSSDNSNQLDAHDARSQWIGLYVLLQTLSEEPTSGVME